jgi:amino acid transporter
MQIVPYFMTGFESVGKAAEEAAPEFRAGGYFKAIVAAIVVGFVFYVIVIGAVAYAAPWKSLLDRPFMTAIAFEQAVGSRWIVNAILAAALLSLFKVFNGNFVASSRMLFALGRRGLIDERFATVHFTNRTPSTAVVWTGIVTAACMFLGQAILVPISEVGSVASAIGWTAACASYYLMRPTPIKKTIAAVGVLLGTGMIAMKVVPALPGHFTGWEWLALILWICAGIALRTSSRLAKPANTAG